MARIGALHKSVRVLVGIASVFLGMLAAAPAASQTTATVITPLKTQPDINNVNITDGLVRIDVPSLSVPAAPRLKFDLVQNVMPYLVAQISGGSGSYIQSSIAVHTGASSSERFSCTFDDVCRNVKSEGAVIGGDVVNGSYYTFTESQSGAVYAFDRLEYDSGSTQQTRQVQHYASSIAYPDGEVISFTYDTAPYYIRTLYRVTRMSSNLGYYITVSYQGSDAIQNATAWLSPAQATLYNASVPSTPLGQLTYGANGTITDLAGRTYTCSGCVNIVGAQLEWPSATVTLPGESSSAEAVTQFQPIPNNGAILPVVSSVARDGVTWSYSYTNFRQTVGQSYGYDNVVVSGPSGYHETYNITVDTAGNPNLISSIVDSNSRRTSYSYDTNFRPTLITYPEGNSVQIGYDFYGNITSKVSQPKPGSGLAAVTESAGIDAAACGQSPVLCFRPTYYIDGLGRRTDYAYDSAGRLTQRTDPADSTGVRRATYLSYGSSFTAPTLVRVCGLGTTCGTGSEFKTQYTYWGNTALPATETVIDGVAGTSLTTTYTYDNAGRLLVTDGPLPGTSDAEYFRYDVLGRKTWEIGLANADGTRQATRYTYRDSDNKAVAVETGTIPDAASAALTVATRDDITYDAHRNAIKTATSAGGTIYKVMSSSFDDRGQQICATVRMNPAVFGSSIDGCTLGTQGSAGPDRITRNTYDAAGQLLQVQKAYGTPLQQNYATYTYSPNGKQITVQDANGNLAALAYDGFDRLAQWTFPSKTTTGQVNAADYESYGYDAVGNRTSLRKRDGRTIAYTYDALNRVTLKSINGACVAGYACTTPPSWAARNVYYAYDLRNLQTAARFDSPTGTDAVTNSYDGFGRLMSSTTAMGGYSRTLGYQYDADGNRTQLTYPDGRHITYGYDGGNRMVSADWSPGTRFLTIVYDAQGRRYSTNRASSWTYYTYDPVSRPAAETQSFSSGTSNLTSTFGYNPASQITSFDRSNDAYAFSGYASGSKSYVTNGLNQYTTAGPATLGYDSNGNLASDGTTSYTYDVENRLVTAAGALNAALTYDPLGRLWQTVGQTTHQLLYDGDALVSEYDGAGTMLHRYAYGPGVDEPILWDSGSSLDCSQTKFLHPDHQGSIVAVADCWGNPLAINAYDEYGVPGTGNVGRFQYTGQAYLPELGMYYYKARIYSSRLGRFLQTDPVGYADQNNLYTYAANDPVNEADPSGKVGMCTGSLIVGKDGQCPGGGFTAGMGTCSGDCTPADNSSKQGKAGPAPGAGPNIAKAMANARARGVARAWSLERKIVRANGAGTRNWTDTQRRELIRTGRVEGYVGHHINTVNGNSVESAENPDNIRFMSVEEHAEYHQSIGGYRVPTSNLPMIERTAMAEAAEEAIASRVIQSTALSTFAEVFEEIQ